MSPDNEYFWIDPEEVRALAPRGKKGGDAVAKPAGAVPAMEPSPTAAVETPPLVPAPEGVEADHGEPGQGTAAITAATVSATGGGASTSAGAFVSVPAGTTAAGNFVGRTPEERLEQFVEWLVATHGCVSAMVLSGKGQVLTARGASPELLRGAASLLRQAALPIGGQLGTGTIRVRPLQDYTGTLSPSGQHAYVLPVYCEPAGELLGVVAVAGDQQEAFTTEIPTVHLIFVDLAEAMARG